MIEYGHFIGGKQVAGKSGRTAEVFQPMDGTVRAHVALASKAEVRAAVENAKAAQPAWAAVNPQRRARVLMKFIDLIAKNNDEMAETLAPSTARRSLTRVATSSAGSKWSNSRSARRT